MVTLVLFEHAAVLRAAVKRGEVATSHAQVGAVRRGSSHAALDEHGVTCDCDHAPRASGAAAAARAALELNATRQKRIPAETHDVVADCSESFSEEDVVQLGELLPTCVAEDVKLNGAQIAQRARARDRRKRAELHDADAPGHGPIDAAVGAGAGADR